MTVCVQACHLRKGEVSDVPYIVDIHRRSFPRFFLTFMGPQFLRQLYISVIRDRSGIVWVAERNGMIEGFVAGTIDSEGFYLRLVKQRVIFFAFASVWPLLRRPTIVRRLFRALLKPREARAQIAGAALLMSLAVDPSVQKKGEGRELVQAFVQEAKAREVSAVVLTTDAVNNDNVNHFYQRCGFCVGRSYLTPEGRKMSEYVLSL